MLAKILSYGLTGITGYPVEIELDINAGLPGYDVVGLADTAIKESKSRVKAAIKNSTYNYPIHKIIINLAPADTKKEGSIIEKTRYTIKENGLNYEIDIFHGDLAPMAYLEIEFPSVEDAVKFKSPSWVIKDVTDDFRYKNAGLAKYGKPE